MVLQENQSARDLHFIYKAIVENHPGIYNEEDPNFKKDLENSYTTAKLSIKKSLSDSNSKIIISDFIKSFNDTHLSIHWFNNSSKKNDTDTKNFSILEPSKEVAWITLPTFSLSTKQEKDFINIIKKLEELRTKKYIIFDLRKNQGGSSNYGSQIVDTLFGKEYTRPKKCLKNKKEFVDWRVSDGNLAHISHLLIQSSTSLILSPISQWLKNIKKGLEQSLERGDYFYREHSDETCGSIKSVNSKFNFKVVVITDSCNVSAALGFIDELKIVTEKIVLIGQKTKADRLYMEVRSLPLPSGLGNFFFPIKVYRNRLRLDNESYIPNIEFKNIQDTSALESFILKKIDIGEL